MQKSVCANTYMCIKDLAASAYQDIYHDTHAQMSTAFDLSLQPQ